MVELFCHAIALPQGGTGDMNLDWTLPYPSRRASVVARNSVATSQPLAAQAGLQTLARGGNAVDAALATAIALTVVEPTMNGLGGDAFAIVWDGAQLHGLNASGRAPGAWTPARFAGREAMPSEGWDAVTVPGAVSAWVTLSARFGRLPFVDLFEAAIRYASDGFYVTPVIADQWAQAAERFAGLSDFGGAFLPGGRPPRTGERFLCPGQAASLEMIANSNGEAFYRGELAATMIRHANANGGVMTLTDLADHHADWVDCIPIEYRDCTVHELPPNGQGIATLIALGILRHTEISELPVDSVASVHLQLEAMKIAFAETYQHVADPKHMQVRIDTLLDDAMLARRAAAIDRARATAPRAEVGRDRGTVLLTTADADGMMVSFIQSNFDGFGSGVVVPGTGIALQNRANGFVLEDGHPNQVGGGKRPFHTIIPGFVTEGGAPRLAFGLMGGPMQAQGHLQLLVRIIDHQQNPQAASDAPRWRIEADSTVSLEPGFDKTVAAELAARGHPVEVDASVSFGGAQLIYRLDNGAFCAASDHRKDGFAVGF